MSDIDGNEPCAVSGGAHLNIDSRSDGAWCMDCGELLLDDLDRTYPEDEDDE